MRTKRGWIGLGLVLAAGAGGGAWVTQARVASAQVGFNASGVWNTQWAGSASVITLVQAGQFVTGTYTAGRHPPGAMAGAFRGNMLIGRWTDPTSSGGIVLAFSPDGRSVTGTWGRSPDSNTSGGPWIGGR